MPCWWCASPVPQLGCPHILRSSEMRGRGGAGPDWEDAMGIKAHFNLNAVNMLRVIWDKWDT